MKLSELIEIAQIDLEQYGDMDVVSQDDDGDVREVYYSATHGDEFLICWR